ncbi:PilZ domain-containing protein [Pseudobacteriovorax antillogorgiicola]|uniref:PilZ domain-containing protein n=1 Tax=Pseudobacteriovorax antillogorgiicola TaxID=1513793 RepID=UPI002286A0F4|nr:PilZ domain-containing protein [Pseudobacteriovorax antillogorgiicola]
MQLATHEKRQFVRYPVDKDMQIILKGRSVPARLLNVSERGAGILVAPELMSPEEEGLVILRCEVGSEIIDVSLEIRHFSLRDTGLYLGAEVITDLKKGLTHYIHHHEDFDRQDSTLEVGHTDEFLQQIKVLSSQAFQRSSSERLGKEKAWVELSQNQWTSFIGLSSQILTTRFYINYNLDSARSFARLGDDAPDSKIHDYMREKTNIIAGSIKRWLLSHQSVDQATCENFRVRMPCTEKVDQATCKSLGCADHGMVWKIFDGDDQSSEILCCVMLQIDEYEKASEFLRLLTIASNEEPPEDDDIEFL